LPTVLRACHPSMGATDLTIADDCDGDWLGMVVVCAIAARRTITILPTGRTADLLTTMQRAARIAQAVSHTLTPQLYAARVVVEFEAVAS
jgi:hypothetical protein